MTQQTLELMQPPADVPEIQRGNWYLLPVDDPVVLFVVENLWPQPTRPEVWEVARLSSAAYLYREKSSHWTVVAKFYSVKTGETAEKYSQRELLITEKAFSAVLDQPGLRSVKPLGTWRGVLFLEYIDGLTLEDMIAVRRSRPGTLMPALENAARLLACLHSSGSGLSETTDFAGQVHKARKIINVLAGHGVIQDEPLIVNALELLLDRWSSALLMTRYVPTFTHGDTTTSNFIYPWEGGMVALDWERARNSDPAFDLGRLMAEVSHSINQHGGSHAEAQNFVDYLADIYGFACPESWDMPALFERARFYRAISTLRIARNGWVSRLDRTLLVAQALALLEKS